jgi:hypothetical protein
MLAFKPMSLGFPEKDPPSDGRRFVSTEGRLKLANRCRQSGPGLYNPDVIGMSSKGQVRFILMSVVGTNSDPSDEIHLWIIISFFLLTPQVTPGTLSSTPRQVSRVKVRPWRDRTLDLSLNETHPSALV